MYSFNSKKELAEFIANEVIETRDAAKILGCTRQNIDDLVKRGKLKPIKTLYQGRLFFKEDVLARKGNL